MRPSLTYHTTAEDVVREIPDASKNDQDEIKDYSEKYLDLITFKFLVRNLNHSCHVSLLGTFPLLCFGCNLYGLLAVKTICVWFILTEMTENTATQPFPAEMSAFLDNQVNHSLYS